MQKWQYLEIEDFGDEVSVSSSAGRYFAKEDYEEIDPEGRINRYNARWQPALERERFLLRLLDKLGSEGWEALGNINNNSVPGILLILKRPIDDRPD